LVGLRRLRPHDARLRVPPVVDNVRHDREAVV
jgi:hypothetical protein